MDEESFAKKRRNVDIDTAQAHYVSVQLKNVESFTSLLKSIDPGWTDDTGLRDKTVEKLKSIMFGPTSSNPEDVPRISKKPRVEIVEELPVLPQEALPAPVLPREASPIPEASPASEALPIPEALPAPVISRDASPIPEASLASDLQKALPIPEASPASNLPEALPIPAASPASEALPIPEALPASFLQEALPIPEASPASNLPEALPIPEASLASDLPEASPIPEALPAPVISRDASPIPEDSLVLSREASTIPILSRESSQPASYAAGLFPNRSLVQPPMPVGRNGYILNMLRGVTGDDILVKAMKSFFAEEFEACAKNFISFKELKGLFLLYVGPSTPQAKSIFKHYCKTLLIDQFPCAENKVRDNKKGYVNVRRKLAH
jgi:hypothetical protein